MEFKCFFKTSLARQERAPTPKIAIKMILSLFGRLIPVRVLMGIPKIHMSSKMLTPALTEIKLASSNQAHYSKNRRRLTIEVDKSVNALLVCNSENVPVDVYRETLYDRNYLRGNP
jgi:hypothetical protein